MTTKKNSKRSLLQQRLAECERGARLIKGLFEAGDGLPNFLTDAIMDALSAAAGFKGIEYFGETDFDMDGLASLFFVTRHFDLRQSTEGLAYHIAAVMNNPETPDVIINDLGEALCVIGSGKIADSAGVIAFQLGAYKVREEVKVGEGGER